MPWHALSHREQKSACCTLLKQSSHGSQRMEQSIGENWKWGCGEILRLLGKCKRFMLDNMMTSTWHLESSVPVSSCPLTPTRYLDKQGPDLGSFGCYLCYWCRIHRTGVTKVTRVTRVTWVSGVIGVNGVTGVTGVACEQVGVVVYQVVTRCDRLWPVNYCLYLFLRLAIIHFSTG